MADRTGIEWTDATWNPIRGCSRVSEGCRHCYAESVAARFSGEGQPYYQLARRRANGEPQWTGVVRFIPEHLGDPLRWQRPRRIFVNSMSDLFHDGVSDREVAAIFGVMAAAPRHTFQVLTKRPARMRALLSRLTVSEILLAAALKLGEEDFQRWRKSDVAPKWPLQNVWLGVSVEDQDAADERIPQLLETPAAVRFLSCEPLLGPVSLARVPVPMPRAYVLPGIDQVIVGGESGANARPMHPAWARALRDECVASGVAFFFKQWGEWKPISEMPERETDALYLPPPENDPEAIRECRVPTRAVQFDGEDGFWVVEGHNGYQVFKVGKKRAGRTLDGRTWDEQPQLAREVAHA